MFVKNILLQISLCAWTLQVNVTIFVRRVKTAPCAIRQLNFNAKYGHYKMVQKLWRNWANNSYYNNI